MCCHGNAGQPGYVCTHSVNGNLPCRHFLLLFRVVPESQNQGCPVQKRIFFYSTLKAFHTLIICFNNILKVINNKIKAQHFSIIHLLPFLSLFTFDSLGSCGPNWTSVSLVKQEMFT